MNNDEPRVHMCLLFHVLNLFQKKLIKYGSARGEIRRGSLVHGYGTIKGMHDMLTNGEKLLTSRYKDISVNVPPVDLSWYRGRLDQL